MHFPSQWKHFPFFTYPEFPAAFPILSKFRYLTISRSLSFHPPLSLSLPPSFLHTFTWVCTHTEIHAHSIRVWYIICTCQIWHLHVKILTPFCLWVLIFVFETVDEILLDSCSVSRISTSGPGMSPRMRHSSFFLPTFILVHSSI